MPNYYDPATGKWDPEFARDAEWSIKNGNRRWPLSKAEEYRLEELEQLYRRNHWYAWWVKEKPKPPVNEKLEMLRREFPG